MKTSFSKLLLLFTVLFSSTTVSFAQQVTIEYSEPIKKDYFRDAIAIVGKDPEGIYLLEGKKKGSIIKKKEPKVVPFVSKYNFNGQTIFEKEIVFPATPDGAKKLSFEALVYTGGNIHIIGSHFSGKEDENHAYLSRMSDKGIIDSKIQEVDKINAKRRWNDGEFHFRVSNDSSKILVYHDGPFKARKEENFGISVYSPDFNLIWEKSLQLPYRDKDVYIRNLLVDNEGNVFLLCSYNVSRTRVNFSIFTYKADSESPEEYKLSGIKGMPECVFDITPDEHLILAGFYHDGTFYMKFNRKTKEIVSKSEERFDKGVFDLVAGKEVKSDKKYISNLNMSDVIIKDDGSSILVAEQAYTEEEVTITASTAAPTKKSVSKVYHYKSIIVVNVDPGGKIRWVKVIPKYQTSKDDNGYYLSYALAEYEDKVMLIYHDHKSNVDREAKNKKLKKMEFLSSSNLVGVVIDAEGNAVKRVLSDYKSADKFIARPRVSFQVKDDQLIMVASRTPGHFKFCTINLK